MDATAKGRDEVRQVLDWILVEIGAGMCLVPHSLEGQTWNNAHERCKSIIHNYRDGSGLFQITARMKERKEMPVTGETKMWLDEREARERAEREVIRLKDELAVRVGALQRTADGLGVRITELTLRVSSEANRASDWKTVSGLLSALVGVLVYFLSRR